MDQSDEMDWMEKNGPKWTKQTKVEQVDQNDTIVWFNKSVRGNNKCITIINGVPFTQPQME